MHAWDTVCHRFPNHSVIAPQFCTMAMIPAMAAATAAITAMIGRSEMLSAPKDTARAAMTGARAVNAAISAPRMIMKFCTGPGRLENHSLTVVIAATRGGRMVLASSMIFSPSGARDCWAGVCWPPSAAWASAWRQTFPGRSL